MRLRLTQRMIQVRELLAAPDLAVSRRAQAGLFMLRLGLRILKQWARDRCPQQASALAFQTALSLVPVTAIGVALLRSASDAAAEERLFDFVGTQLLPDMPDVVQHLRSFSKNISTNAAGAVSLIFTFITCYSLYASVERICNDIWHTGRKRPLMQRFLTFYALVTLMPFLAAMSLYWSGKLMGAGATQFLGPLLVQFAALFLLNKLLPNTRVTWWAALAGTMVTGVALEGTKIGFVLFAKRTLLQNYEGVYGTLGLIPLVLIWIYLSWLLVLLGVEIANAVQNLRLLEAEDRRRTGDEPINGLTAAQLLAVVAADHQQGGGGVTREELSEAFGLTVSAVEQICGRLQKRGLVAEVHGDKEGYIPARPATSIGLDEVMAAFRATDLETADGRTAPELQELVMDLEQNRRERMSGISIADVLPEGDQSGRVARVLSTAPAIGAPERKLS